MGTYSKKCVVPLNNQGVVWVVGENKDTGGSNGAGKSFPFYVVLTDAIFNTLYGSKGFKGQFQELWFKKDKNSFYVRKTIGHTKHGTSIWIGKNDSKTTVDRSKKGIVNARNQLKELFNITEDEFFGYINLSPNRGVKIVEGKDSERKSYLEAVFGLHDYKNLQSSIGEYRDAISEKVDKYQPYVEELKFLTQKKFEEEDIQTLETIVNKCDKRIRQFEKDKDSYEEKIEDLVTKIGNKNKRQELQKQYKPLTKFKDEDLSELNTFRSKIDKKIFTLQDVLTKSEEIKKITSKLDKYKAILKKESITPKDKKAIEKKNDTLTKKYYEVKSSIEADERFLVKLEKMNKPVCPTCNQKIDLEGVKKNIKRIKKSSSKLKDSKRSLSKSIADSTAKLEFIRTFEELKKQLDFYDVEDYNIKDLNKKLKSLSSKKDRLLDVIEGVREYKSIKNLLSKYPKDKHGDLEPVLKSLKDEYRDLDVDVKDKLKEKAEAEYKIQKIKKIEKTLTKLKTAVEKHKNYEKKLKFYNCLYEAYGERGLKLKQLNKICKNLLKILPVYTNIMFNEKNISFSIDPNKEDGFSIHIQRKLKDGKVVSYDIRELSSGEKRRLIPAFMVATALTSPKHKKFNFIVLDELDSHLDDVGKVNFAEKLVPLLKKHYSTIIVMSHSKNMYSRHYDKIWKVVKENDSSEIEVQQA